MTGAQPHNYRFGQRDRTGWLLGLNGAQCAAIGAGILLSGALLNARVPAPMVLAPLLVSATFAFGRWNGRPLHDIAPLAFGWTARRVSGEGKWFAELPRYCTAKGRPGRALSAAMAG